MRKVKKQFSTENVQKLAFFALILFTLLMFGCSGFGDKNKPLGIPEVFTGTEGLAVGFAPESVPNLATSGGSFDVVLLIANKGSVEVTNALVSVKDTRGVFAVESVKGQDNLFSFEKSLIRLTGSLPGKEKTFSTTGSVEGLTATLKVNQFSASEDAVDTGLLATACYQYRTKLSVNVCIDASPYSFQKQRKPCEAKAPLILKSQGSPVAVKKIETILEKSGSYVRPKFKIFIGNVGNGLIIDQNKLDLFCTATPQSEEDKPKINVVKLENVELNERRLGSGIRCSEAEKVLSGKAENDFILCIYEGNDFEDGSGTFATPLKAELSYGYTSTSDPVPVKVEKGIS